jgi:hypothetical protein
MAINNIAKCIIPSGRLPYKHDKRTLKFRTIVCKADKDIKIPVEYDWGSRIKPNHNWGDYGNLKLNNCTYATAAHAVLIWKSYKLKNVYRPSTNTIINDYGKMIREKRSLKELQTLLDKGGKPLEAVKVLNSWRKKGIDGHKIVAYAKLSFRNKKQQQEEVKRVIYLYGGCYIGIDIPRSVEKQWQQNKVWKVIKGVPAGDARRRLWFSHALLATGYNEKELRVITFGKEETMTWEFFAKYVDEAYVVFDEKFLLARKTPSKMRPAELKKFTSGIKKAGSKPAL